MEINESQSQLLVTQNPLRTHFTSLHETAHRWPGTRYRPIPSIARASSAAMSANWT